MSGLHDSLLVIGIAAAPIVELRGSIPFAVGVLHMSVLQAVVLSVVGNSLLLFAVYAVGGWWIGLMSSRQGLLPRMTNRVLTRAGRVMGNGRYERYGLLALTLFVAVPLPMTGVLTGSVAALLFGLSLRKAGPYILLGMLMAAIVVTLITTGALSFLRFLISAPTI
ncbi:MAG: small multi-drug export protein [bacterium]